MTTPEPLKVVLRDGFALIRRFIRARPGAFALAVGGATVYASAIVASAVVVGRVTDDLVIPVLDGGEAAGNRWLAGVLIIAGVAAYKAAGITLRRTFAGWLQGRTQADVRYQLIDHQLRLHLSWFNRQSTGDLLAVSETDGRQATYILAPLPYGTGSLALLVGLGANCLFGFLAQVYHRLLASFFCRAGTLQLGDHPGRYPYGFDNPLGR